MMALLSMLKQMLTMLYFFFLYSKTNYYINTYGLGEQSYILLYKQ